MGKIKCALCKQKPAKSFCSSCYAVLTQFFANCKSYDPNINRGYVDFVLLAYELRKKIATFDGEEIKSIGDFPNCWK